MHQIVSRVLLLVSVVVLIATSPDDKPVTTADYLPSHCSSDPLSLTLSPDNMSQELELELYRFSEYEFTYILEFTILGPYSGEENAILTLSALDETGVVMEDQVISTELELSDGGDTVESISMGTLTLNLIEWDDYDFLIELDSSYEYSFDLLVEISPEQPHDPTYDCVVGFNERN